MIEKRPLKEIIDQAQQFLSQDQFDAALKLLGQVIGQFPDNPYIIYLYATCKMQLGDFGVATVLLHNVVRLRPDFAAAHNNLACCYRREYHIELARQAAMNAIELKPDFPDAYNNMASNFVNEGCPAGGLEYSDKAISMFKPDSIEWHRARFNKALMLLELGRYIEGFGLYESGLGCHERPRRNYTEGVGVQTPYLEHIRHLAPGKTVVVYGEQGMGDEIMFLSCLQNIIDTGATVILDAHPRMTGMFARSFPDLEIHNTRKRQDLTWPLDRQIDYCVAVGSLPRLYLQNHDRFEKRAYIKPEPKVAEGMAAELRDGRPVIGLAWSGGTRKTNNQYRTLDKELVQMIAENPQYKFVSLQYENDGYMPEGVEPSWEITQHYNYDLTACLVEACDAVVAINTSVVHLAGAMGKRVFCLTPSKPAWRYGVAGEGMPFYPDVHQYRQEGDNWNIAITRLMNDLNLWANLNNTLKVAP